MFPLGVRIQGYLVTAYTSRNGVVVCNWKEGTAMAFHVKLRVSIWTHFLIRDLRRGIVGARKPPSLSPKGGLRDNLMRRVQPF